MISTALTDLTTPYALAVISVSAAGLSAAWRWWRGRRSVSR